jgi:dihydropteroate synthase
LLNLLEPLGLLSGPDARAALAAGLALPFGHQAYTLARLITPAGDAIIRATELPASWRPIADRLAAPSPSWAGLGTEPAIMGVINVTPDSFSDGGDHFATEHAIQAGHAMLAAGAALLDIGGESTRPGARPVPPDEEQARILPVIRALAGQDAIISVDTRNAATMEAALDAGARIINDVSALTHDPAAAPLLARRGAPVILMHMRGTPATMNEHAAYDNLAVDVLRELAARLEAACAAGISAANIALDPGIGFAKVGAQNHELLRRLPLLCNLGCPLVVGVSRKRFIGAISNATIAKTRTPGSLSAAVFALSRGASVLRVHDVAETIQALRVWQALATD